MKITAINPFAVSVSERNFTIVKIETDAGISGVGEAGESSRELALIGMIKHFREFLIGQDPRRIDHIWQLMYRSQYMEGGRIVGAAASAIDIALWDILGKSLGVPVHVLLGGKSRDYVTCFIDCYRLNEESCVEAARMRVAEGWRTLRFVPEMPGKDRQMHHGAVYEPFESIDVTLHWLREVRRAVGDGVRLGLDFHHRLSPAEAAYFCRRADDLHLMFLEEPIRCESPAAYQGLRRMTSIPFAIGEEFSSKWDFAPYVEQDIANYARVDLCMVGGLTEAKKIAAMCEAHYIDVMPHNPWGPICTAATLHFDAAVPNFALQEHNVPAAGFPRDLFPVQPLLDGDHFNVPDAPGLGVEFNEQAAVNYPLVLRENPQWVRRDGGYTNF